MNDNELTMNDNELLNRDISGDNLRDMSDYNEVVNELDRLLLAEYFSDEYLDAPSADLDMVKVAKSVAVEIDKVINNIDTYCAPPNCYCPQADCYSHASI